MGTYKPSSQPYEATSKEERDKLLDELERELKTWLEEEKKRINNEASFLKRVLRARAGSAKLLTTNLDAVSKLTARSINRLLGLKAAKEKKD
jgi:hypothetical protein